MFSCSKFWQNVFWKDTFYFLLLTFIPVKFSKDELLLEMIPFEDNYY